MKDCDLLRINSTHAEITWHGMPDLPALMNHRIRLVLEGSRTKVFSFIFQP